MAERPDVAIDMEAFQARVSQMTEEEKKKLAIDLQNQETAQAAFDKMEREAREMMVVQERSPLFTKGDRALIKNLATSPEVGKKYLEDKYPNADVQIIGGQIVGRPKKMDMNGLTV